MKTCYALILICLTLIIAIFLVQTPPPTIVDQKNKEVPQRVVQVPQETVYQPVRNVELSNGLLRFSTSDSAGLRNYCFRLNNTNLMITESEEIDNDAIKIEDANHETLAITFPRSLGVDIETFLKNLH